MWHNRGMELRQSVCIFYFDLEHCCRNNCRMWLCWQSGFFKKKMISPLCPVSVDVYGEVCVCLCVCEWEKEIEQGHARSLPDSHTSAAESPDDSSHQLNFIQRVCPQLHLSSLWKRVWWRSAFSTHRWHPGDRHAGTHTYTHTLTMSGWHDFSCIKGFTSKSLLFLRCHKNNKHTLDCFSFFYASYSWSVHSWKSCLPTLV